MTIENRLAQLDWKAIEASLWQRGYAKTASLLTAKECEALVALYCKDQLFRSRIDMKRFRFGEGEYKYFTYPLPPLVQALREQIYPRLAVIANAWVKALGQLDLFPLSHDQLLAFCRQNGQTKPTPLLLSYGAGDYNCLHQEYLWSGRVPAPAHRLPQSARTRFYRWRIPARGTTTAHTITRRGLGPRAG